MCMAEGGGADESAATRATRLAHRCHVAMTSMCSTIRVRIASTAELVVSDDDHDGPSTALCSRREGRMCSAGSSTLIYRILTGRWTDGHMADCIRAS